MRVRLRARSSWLYMRYLGEFSYTYQAVPVYKVTTLVGYKQQWVDSAWNGDGQLRGDGDILGLVR